MRSSILIFETGTDDHSMGFAWMEKAAKSGNAEAMHDVAVMINNGQGVTQSLSIARHWCLRACDQNHEAAKHYLTELNVILARKEREEQAVADAIVARQLARRIAREEGGGQSDY